MKFSSVSFSEDSSPKLYQMCGQILTFPERKVRLDTQHGDHIQQNQLHVNVLGDHHKSIQPDWKKKSIIHAGSSQSHAQGSLFLPYHFKDGSS